MKIPKMEEYFFHDGAFHLKNPLAKKFRVGLVIGIVIGSLLGVNTTEGHLSQKFQMRPSSTYSAYVDYVQSVNKNISLTDAALIVKSTMKYAEEFNIDEKLLLAIQQVESKFDKHAISSAGAFGVMQVIPSWHLDKIVKARKTIGTPELFAIDTNIFLGTWIFKDCLDKFKLTDKAARCYNGTIGKDTVYDQHVLSKYQEIKTYVKRNA